MYLFYLTFFCFVCIIFFSIYGIKYLTNKQRLFHNLRDYNKSTLFLNINDIFNIEKSNHNIECNLKENKCSSNFICTKTNNDINIFTNDKSKKFILKSSNKNMGYCIKQSKNFQCNSFTGIKVLTFAKSKTTLEFEYICICKYPNLVDQISIFHDCNVVKACLPNGELENLNTDPFKNGKCKCNYGFINKFSKFRGPYCVKQNISTLNKCYPGTLNSKGFCTCPDGYLSTPHPAIDKDLPDLSCIKNPCSWDVFDKKFQLKESELKFFKEEKQFFCFCNPKYGNISLSTNSKIITSTSKLIYPNACFNIGGKEVITPFSEECLLWQDDLLKPVKCFILLKPDYPIKENLIKPLKPNQNFIKFEEYWPFNYYNQINSLKHNKLKPLLVISEYNDKIVNSSLMDINEWKLIFEKGDKGFENLTSQMNESLPLCNKNSLLSSKFTYDRTFVDYEGHEKSDITIHASYPYCIFNELDSPFSKTYNGKVVTNPRFLDENFQKQGKFIVDYDTVVVNENGLCEPYSSTNLIIEKKNNIIIKRKKPFNYENEIPSYKLKMIKLEMPIIKSKMSLLNKIFHIK